MDDLKDDVHKNVAWLDIYAEKMKDFLHGLSYDVLAWKALNEVLLEDHDEFHIHNQAGMVMDDTMILLGGLNDIHDEVYMNDVLEDSTQLA